ncbi:hypothetical protein [Spirosoma oryzae]|uniref:hypothetical protein n=1 Tax=Spirosoma oryzae TaxID=1469603 RepID=UPI000D04C5E7|nr:hypothetical protein [Spirosoma oryzae]
MNLSTPHLRYLLTQLPRLSCPKKHDIYRTVLETALLRPDRRPYQPEIELLTRAFGGSANG